MWGRIAVRWGAVAIAAYVLAVRPAAAQPTPCTGDCDGDGVVEVHELILGVNMALQIAAPTACPAFDMDADGRVAVADLVTAVSNALGDTCRTPVETTRTFTIEPGMLLGDPSQTRSGLFNTLLSGANAAIAVSPGPLTLALGEPDADGVAPLRLAEDAIIDVQVVDSTRVCIKMMAAGSSGSVDCDGGTAYDVEGFQAAGDTGSTLFEVRTGLGDPAGPGHGNLLVNQLTQPLPVGELRPCEEIEYTAPAQQFAYTTTNAIALKGTRLRLPVPGEPFDCARFADPTSGGILAAPAPTWRADVRDVAAVFRYGEAQ